ncbi:MAG: hypothetical protein EXS63_08440 [Candidatus Omnitrophica bacterium]|nr:hypothetical protein [Candidatus Omnitrophota bacterium]
MKTMMKVKKITAGVAAWIFMLAQLLPGSVPVFAASAAPVDLQAVTAAPGQISLTAVNQKVSAVSKTLEGSKHEETAFEPSMAFLAAASSRGAANAEVKNTVSQSTAKTGDFKDEKWLSAVKEIKDSKGVIVEITRVRYQDGKEITQTIHFDRKNNQTTVSESATYRGVLLNTSTTVYKGIGTNLKKLQIRETKRTVYFDDVKEDWAADRTIFIRNDKNGNVSGEIILDRKLGQTERVTFLKGGKTIRTETYKGLDVNVSHLVLTSATEQSKVKPYTEKVFDAIDSTLGSKTENIEAKYNVEAMSKIIEDKYLEVPLSPGMIRNPDGTLRTATNSDFPVTPDDIASAASIGIVLKSDGSSRSMTAEESAAHSKAVTEEDIRIAAEIGIVLNLDGAWRSMTQQEYDHELKTHGVDPSLGHSLP